MKGVNLAVFGALLLAGCSGGSSPVVNTYPLNGTFRQVSIGGSSCPGSASSSTGVAVSCGPDYRIEFDSTARTYRYFDNATPSTTISQGAYSVQGTQLTLEENTITGIRILKNAFTFAEPALSFVYTFTGSGNATLAFQRL